MSKNYAMLQKQAMQFYLGDIDEDDFKTAFKNWAIKYGVKMPKRFMFLKSTYGNDKSDISPIVSETEGEIYYYDGFGRYCYLTKSERGDIWEMYDE